MARLAFPRGRGARRRVAALAALTVVAAGLGTVPGAVAADAPATHPDERCLGHRLRRWSAEHGGSRPERPAVRVRPSGLPGRGDGGRSHLDGIRGHLRHRCACEACAVRRRFLRTPACHRQRPYGPLLRRQRPGNRPDLADGEQLPQLRRTRCDRWSVRGRDRTLLRLQRGIDRQAVHRRRRGPQVGCADDPVHHRRLGMGIGAVDGEFHHRSRHRDRPRTEEGRPDRRHRRPVRDQGTPDRQPLDLLELRPERCRRGVRPYGEEERHRAVRPRARRRRLSRPARPDRRETAAHRLPHREGRTAPGDRGPARGRHRRPA